MLSSALINFWFILADQVVELPRFGRHRHSGRLILHFACDWLCNMPSKPGRSMAFGRKDRENGVMSNGSHGNLMPSRQSELRFPEDIEDYGGRWLNTSELAKTMQEDDGDGDHDDDDDDDVDDDGGDDDCQWSWCWWWSWWGYCSDSVDENNRPAWLKSSWLFSLERKMPHGCCLTCDCSALQCVSTSR